MRDKFSLLAGVCATAVCATAVSTPVFAKDAAPESSGIQEIIVTAQRQAQRLQDVPIAVTAFTAQNLERQQIKNTSDLQLSLPSVTFTKTNFTSSSFTIRGIGDLCVGVSCDSATAIHLNDAPLFQTRLFEGEFYDLSQVEVLRGPQGTLYGRGATAGAINLITKRPTEDTEGYLRATYSNYNAVALEGAIGGALVKDKLLVRLAGKYDVRDGYGVNEFTGSQIDNRKAYAFRGSVLIKAAADVNILLSAETFHENDNNYAFHYFGPTVAPENALGSLIGGQSIFTIAAAKGVQPNLRDLYSGTDPINHRGIPFRGGCAGFQGLSST